MPARSRTCVRVCVRLRLKVGMGVHIHVHHLRLVHLLKARRCLYNPGGQYLPGWRVGAYARRDASRFLFPSRTYTLLRWRESCNNLCCFHDNHLLLSPLICLSLFSIPPSHSALNAVLVFQGQSGSCGDRQRDSGRDSDECAGERRRVKTTGEKTGRSCLSLSCFEQIRAPCIRYMRWKWKEMKERIIQCWSALWIHPFPLHVLHTNSFSAHGRPCQWCMLTSRLCVLCNARVDMCVCVCVRVGESQLVLMVQRELNMLCACEKVAVTLLAPGRRWSFTYGSASPLESMDFSPCGHKQTHKSTKTSCHIRCTRVSGVRGW